MTIVRRPTNANDRSNFAITAKREVFGRSVVAAPNSAISQARRTPVFGRLKEYALRVVEVLLRLVLLSGAEREALRGASRAAEPGGSEGVERSSAYLGHGCLGLFDADGPVGDPFVGRPVDAPRAACEALVIGRGPLSDDVLDKFQAEGVPTHAVASDIEECLRLIRKGVTPHRADDLPYQASRMDLIISTDHTQFVDAGMLARLPDNAVIFDLTGPPGGVNYELAQKFDVKVVWARPPCGVRRQALAPDLWREIQTILTSRRETAQGE